jgi:ABC-type multidrug transport system fused ATPase/permease subunit
MIAFPLLAGSGGSWIVAFLVISTFLLAEATFLSIDTWLALYSQQDPSTAMNESTFLYVYAGLTVAFFSVLLIRAGCYAAFTIRACRVLYAKLQSNIFLLPMSFFWSTPMGRLLNRLSKDTNDIDIFLPQMMQWLIMTMVRVVGILVIISYTVPVFMAAILPFLILYYFIREYYRVTSVSVQRIESVMRSPIYSHLGETLQGCSTLKAYGKQRPWLRVAEALLASNHRAFFAVEAVQSWLALRLELLGAGVVFVTALCVVATDAPPGLAGLALAYALNIIINLNMAVQMATQTESKMNAVERVVEYAELLNEEEIDAANGCKDLADLPPGWPRTGKVEFENVSLQYRADLEPAVRDLSLTIPAGTKVGVCGKTGAGKSTIAAALLRVAPLSSGRVLIDGVDASTVKVGVLRTAVSSVPQDGLLWSASLRANIDPFKLYTDEQVWAAVDKAYLRKTVDSLPDGLNSMITEAGDNLSVGERQLVCICRAVLRHSKVVLLDEASANLDLALDELIQKTIRESFGPECTLLVISHRLDSVLNLDKILIMDNGTVAEFGPVAELLDKKDGMFASLVKASQSK